MPEELMVSIGIIAICTAVVGVAWQIGSAFRFRADAARETAYRTLLQETNDAQGRFAEALERAVEEIGALRQRSEEMERLLKDVA